MARKKKKGSKKKKEEKEEGYEFVPPEFDEETFLRKDIKTTKALIVTVLSALGFAVMAYFAGLVDFILGLLVLLIGVISLRYIYTLTRVPTEDLEKKSWAGNFILFVLLCLGLWILFLNPPFSDHTSPLIEDSAIWVYDTSVDDWVKMNDANRATLINSGETVNITADVTDNGDLESVKINVHLAGNPGEYVDMENVGNITYQYSTSYDTAGTYYYTIESVDGAGNTQISEGSFPVN